MKRNIVWSCAALAAAFLFASAPGTAQELAAGFNPHLVVTNDGRTIPAQKVTVEGMDAFEGLGPEGPLVQRFEDTGAAIDGAQPVLDEESNFSELLDLPGLGQGDLKTIIGNDDRNRVTPTTSFPWRAVALVTFSGGRCTGWFYGPNVVATAGHCVHTGKYGVWRNNVVVYPGRNGNSSPYGFCRARALYTVLGWTAKGDENYDYGVIQLDCTVGNTTGWFGFWWQKASYTGMSVLLSGYPGDRPLTQWKSAGNIGSTGGYQLFYTNDTVGGMSGGPVFQNRAPGHGGCVGYCTMDIHTTGVHGGRPHSQYNHGTRITQAVFNNLLTIRNLP